MADPSDARGKGGKASKDLEATPKTTGKTRGWASAMAAMFSKSRPSTPGPNAGARAEAEAGNSNLNHEQPHSQQQQPPPAPAVPAGPNGNDAQEEDPVAKLVRGWTQQRLASIAFFELHPHAPPQVQPPVNTSVPPPVVAQPWDDLTVRRPRARDLAGPLAARALAPAPPAGQALLSLPAPQGQYNEHETAAQPADTQQQGVSMLARGPSPLPTKRGRYNAYETGRPGAGAGTSRAHAAAGFTNEPNIPEFQFAAPVAAQPTGAQTPTAAPSGPRPGVGNLFQRTPLLQNTPHPNTGRITGMADLTNVTGYRAPGSRLFDQPAASPMTTPTQGIKRGWHDVGEDGVNHTPLPAPPSSVKRVKIATVNRQARPFTPRVNQGDSSRSNSASLATTPVAAGTPGARATNAAVMLMNIQQTPVQMTPGPGGKTPQPNTMGHPGHTPFPRGGPLPPPLDHLTPGEPSPSPQPGTLGKGRFGLIPLAKTPPAGFVPAGDSGSAGLSGATVPAMDMLEGLKPATAARSRSTDGKHRSVRFSVPDNEAAGAAAGEPRPPTPIQFGAGSAAPGTNGTAQTPSAPMLSAPSAKRPRGSALSQASTPAAATAQFAGEQGVLSFMSQSLASHSGKPNTPVTDFSAPQSEWAGIATTMATPGAVMAGQGAGGSGASAAQPAQQAAPSFFSFGQTSAASAPAAPQPPAIAAALDEEQQREQLRIAVTVPLPAEEEEATPAATQETAAPAGTAAAATSQATEPGAATAGNDAAPASNGWGDAFLAKNQQASQAATAAVQKEIEKAAQPASPAPGASTFSFGATSADAGTPAGGFTFGAAATGAATPTPTATPPAAGTAFGFGTPAATPTFAFGATPAAATVTTPAPTSGISFGVTLPATGTTDTQAAAQAANTGATTEQGAAATAAAPAASTWDLSFLNQNKAQEQAAAAAIASEVEAAKGGNTAAAPGSTPAAAASFVFGVTSSAPAFGASAPAFGAPATTDAQTPAFGTSAPGFGASPGLLSPAPGSSPFGGPSFASANAASSAAATTTTAAAPASTPTFGTSTFNFGAGGSTPAAQSQPFGSTSSTPAFGTSGASMFALGQSTAAAGSSMAAMTQPASPTQAFAFTSTPTPAAATDAGTPGTPTFFGATPGPSAAAPAWGQSQPAAAASPQPNFAFGASPAPSGGAPNFMFGSTPPASTGPSGGFVFGAAQQPEQQAPAFGSSFPNGGVFGQQQPTPTMGLFDGAGAGASPSPAPNFSGFATPPTFGNDTTNAGATPFPFAANNASPAFGASPAMQLNFNNVGAATPGTGDTNASFNMGAGAGAGTGERRKVKARRHH